MSPCIGLATPVGISRPHSNAGAGLGEVGNADHCDGCRSFAQKVHKVVASAQKTSCKAEELRLASGSRRGKPRAIQLWCINWSTRLQQPAMGSSWFDHTAEIFLLCGDVNLPESLLVARIFVNSVPCATTLL
eukprot:113012-Amphidinium_carterae.1